MQSSPVANPSQRQIRLAKEEKARRILARAETTPDICLWPDKYAGNDLFEDKWKFVREQHTWNEAEGQEQQFPPKEFLEEYVWEWCEGFSTGRTLVTEKTRRQVISWTARACELHEMGKCRCDCILGGEDFDAAAKHVWRLKFMYAGMQKRGWKLPDHSELKFEGERKLKSFGLGNGSITTYANGQSGGLQGDGVRIITLEEFGLYRYAASMLAQAKIITQGSARSIGGFVNLITNTSLNYEWQQVKKGAIPARV
jgi:hypothetical protein